MQIELSSDFERYQDIPTNGIVPTLLSQIDREEWEIKLDELLVLNSCHAAGKKADPKSVAMQRIAYMVNTAGLHIQPKLQKSKDGISLGFLLKFGFLSSDNGRVPYACLGLLVISLGLYNFFVHPWYMKHRNR